MNYIGGGAFNRAIFFKRNFSQSVYGNTERIYNPSYEGITDWNSCSFSCSQYTASLTYFVVIIKKYTSEFTSVYILNKSAYTGAENKNFTVSCV